MTAQRGDSIKKTLKNSIELEEENAKMQRTVLNFTKLNKLSIFTSQIHNLSLNYLPPLLLCSSRPLNWLLVEERDDYTPSSQHLLRSIGQLASPLLSELLEWSWGVVSVVYMLLVSPVSLLDWGLYRNWLVWPILTS
jgi:hypothetical protein